MRYLFLILLFGLFVSCTDRYEGSTLGPNSDKIKAPQLDTEFELDYEQTKSFENNDISIRFAELISDSRCPEGVQCVWAGIAEIGVEIIVEGREYYFKLTHSPGQIEQEEVVIDDKYAIKFIGLSPYPVYGEEIDVNDYVATLKIYER